MEDREEKCNPRLQIDDKRFLFQSLMAKTDRLLYLNKFPVDMEDFALSLHPIDVEDAWRLMREQEFGPRTLSPAWSTKYSIGEHVFYLTEYDQQHNYNERAPFMSLQNYIPDLLGGNRFHAQVNEWGKRQIKLEAQLLRTVKVLKFVVLSCNTVGQYKRVSPELLTFMPMKYQDALRSMFKRSPYPAIDITQEEIDAAMSTLAFASLQPEREEEKEFNRRPRWQSTFYTLGELPRSNDFIRHDYRKLGL